MVGELGGCGRVLMPTQMLSLASVPIPSPLDLGCEQLTVTPASQSCPQLYRSHAPWGAGDGQLAFSN